MRDEILREIDALARAEEIRILLAVESGSRAWGFESPDSDYDVRFIYVRRTERYLTIEPERDVIEMPISGDLDINGWDIRKALHLFRKGNPPLMEWLNSPVVYHEEPTFCATMRGMAVECFRSCSSLYHYQSMAQRNYGQYIKHDEVRLKKYLYVLRPVLACLWVLRHNEAPPMLFQELLEEAALAPAVHGAIVRLVEQKMALPELGTGPRIAEIDTFIEETFTTVEDYLASQPNDAEVPIEVLDGIFRATLAEWA